MRFATAYDGLNDERSLEFGYEFEGPSMTQQSQKDSTDINRILKDFKVTGIIPQGIRVPSFGDFDGVSDFRSAMDQIIEAERAFMAMPAELRNKLNNDPQLFLEWCSDSDNLDEMRKYGLAVPEAPKAEPLEVRVMNDPAPAPIVPPVK